MDTMNLSAEYRQGTGKGNARKLRRSGQIPALVYRDGVPPLLIQFDPRDLLLGFEKIGNPNTLVNVQLSDTERLCLVKDVQRHPVDGRLRHVDFYKVNDTEEIEVEVSVTATGKSVGVAMGGRLQVIRRTLMIRCKPQDIPRTVEVDVTDLDQDQFIRASEISAPANTELVFGNDFNIVTVIRGRAA
jgi:large subunit ribosomal protein L25